jgi:hypothetical protein
MNPCKLFSRASRKALAAIALVALFSATAAAEHWPFQDYPATVVRQRPAHLKLDTPVARQYVTRIRQALREAKQHGPDFAGHYTVAGWGCGTECAAFVIVDDTTGEVHAPPEIAHGVSLGVGGPEFRPDSRLMVVASCPDPQVYGLERCQRKFYEWDGSQLILRNSEPVTASELTLTH